jgi:hypothetical protein
MKVAELLEARPHPHPSTRSMVYKEYEMPQAKDGKWMEPLDLEIEYTIDGGAGEWHPYGQGHAQEPDWVETDVKSVKTTKPFGLYDEDGQEIVKTYPAGTKVEDLPGYTDKLWKDFEKYVDEKA